MYSELFQFLNTALQISRKDLRLFGQQDNWISTLFLTSNYTVSWWTLSRICKNSEQRKCDRLYVFCERKPFGNFACTTGSLVFFSSCISSCTTVSRIRRRKRDRNFRPLPSHEDPSVRRNISDRRLPNCPEKLRAKSLCQSNSWKYSRLSRFQQHRTFHCYSFHK